MSSTLDCGPAREEVLKFSGRSCHGGQFFVAQQSQQSVKSSDNSHTKTHTHSLKRYTHGALVEKGQVLARGEICVFSSTAFDTATTTTTHTFTHSYTHKHNTARTRGEKKTGRKIATPAAEVKVACLGSSFRFRFFTHAIFSRLNFSDRSAKIKALNLFYFQSSTTRLCACVRDEREAKEELVIFGREKSHCFKRGEKRDIKRESRER